MSTFYGSIQGNRGLATRCGSKASGIHAAVQSYNGSVISELSYNKEGELMVKIAVNSDSANWHSWSNETIFSGSFEEFKAKLTK